MTAINRERTKHLGRGLASLLGPITAGETDSLNPVSAIAINHNILPENDLGDSLREIDIDSISPNPYQPRMVWNERELAELADSIRTNGVIQPIIVRPLGRGYQLVAGERRFRAARQASLAKIPAVVRHASDEQMLEQALIENIHRTDLNPIERARAYENYIKTFSLTQAEAAEHLGENRSVVANYIRLLDLPDEIKNMLSEGELSMGHARAILALPTDDLRKKLANRAMAGRLSVREIERLVKKYLTGSGQTKTAAHSRPPHIVDLENKLSMELGTKVYIEARKNGQRGKIIIEFYSLDDFDRITEKIGLAYS